MDADTITITNLGLLALYLHVHGPIPTACVSSAPGRRWTVARYEIRLTERGVTNAWRGTVERQYSSRTSAASACVALCLTENRLWVPAGGPVSEETAARIVSLLAA